MKIVSIDYGPGMDREIVHLCNVLNSLPGIYTVESCAGHGNLPMSVLFTCKSLKSLAKIQHAIDIRYSGQKNPWRITGYTADTPHHDTTLMFDLASERPYQTRVGRKHDYEPAFYYDTDMFVASIELYSTKWGDANCRGVGTDCPDFIWKKYLKKCESAGRMFQKRQEKWSRRGRKAKAK